MHWIKNKKKFTVTVEYNLPERMCLHCNHLMFPVLADGDDADDDDEICKQHQMYQQLLSCCSNSNSMTKKQLQAAQIIRNKIQPKLG